MSTGLAVFLIILLLISMISRILSFIVHYQNKNQIWKLEQENENLKEELELDK